ncbi:MAG: flagella accessory protein C [Cuniculiplasma divulgatum]|jgi:flagellar protein FlaC|nr:MAG: flagella accessory protein C [Cuniculiplasma divulgatum]
MGLFDNFKGLGKKKKGTTVNVASQPQTVQNTAQPTQGQSIDAKFIDGVNLRIGNVENELSKLGVSMDGVKRNISEMNTELETLKENVKMVVSLYEMVSKKFNPFMDTTPEEIKEITDTLRERIKDLEGLVTSAISDLRELYGVPDLDSVISDIDRKEDDNDQ